MTPDRDALRALLAAEVKTLAEMEASIGPNGARFEMIDAWLDAVRALNIALRNQAPALLSELDRLEALNPCAKIFDHKWLDPECVEGGCQSLLLSRAAKVMAKLVIMARTTGGTAGPDAGLMEACEEAETLLLNIPKGAFAPDPRDALVAELVAALEPFALVAEHDIGEDETDSDLFRPMLTHNRAPRIKVGDLRQARAALAKAGAK